MKHCTGIFAIAILAAAFGCARDAATAEAPASAAAPESPYLTAAPGEDGFVAVPFDKIGEKALFVNVPREGTPTVQLIAIRDRAGNPRIAFNTCQACSPSPRAFFIQLADGSIQCQNCGNVFGPDAVGSPAGGCNPAQIAGLAKTDSEFRIPAASLDSARPAFANWRGPVE